jgi:hypothetical protein
VLAEARTAWNEETATADAVPGFGLKGFGCREISAESVDDATWCPSALPATIRLAAAPPRRCAAGARQRALELPRRMPVVGVFEDGLLAITVHPYGKGWAVFVGTMLSLAYYKFGTPTA